MAASMDFDAAGMVVREGVRMQWRAWRSYLQARIALASVSALEASTVEPSFVHDTDTAAQRRTNAEAQIKSLTAAQRALFIQQVEAARDSIADELRQDHRAKGLREDGLLLDLDDLTHAALARLLDACEGRGEYEGMGDTPMPDGSWYQITIDELNTVSDDLFALATKSGGTVASLRGTFLVIGGMITLLVLYLVSQSWPTAISVDESAVAVLVDATPMPRWATTRVTRSTPSGDQTSDLMMRAGADWASAPDQATLRDDQIYPVLLCLPSAERDDLMALTVHGDGSASDRRYLLSAVEPEQPNLVLVTCGSSPGAPQYGTLADDTLALVDGAVGSTATLADGTQIALLAVATQGQASTQGQGQIQLLLTVQGFGGSLVGYNPTVQVETGETVTTPQRVAGAATGAGTETQQISYALSTADLPRTAIWSIIDPGTGQVYRWRITIDPPLSADTLLAQAIQIGTVQAQRTSPGQITITLTLINQSDAPLAVVAADLTLSSGSKNLPTPIFAPMTLVPGTPRTVTLVIPLSSGQDLVLHLAGQSFQIRDVPAEGG